MVVVNSEKDIEHISRENLALIFLGKKTLWDNDTRITPAMLHERKKPMRQFIELVLHKTLAQYRAYWKRRLFSGGGTVPRTYRTADELMDLISHKPGAIGMHSDPSRVFKGKKMAGHMGCNRKTIKNLQVMGIIPDRNVLLLKGAVSGARNGLLYIQTAKTGVPRKSAKKEEA